MHVIVYLSIGPYHAARISALGRVLGGRLTAVQLYRADATYLWDNAAGSIDGCPCVTVFPGHARDMVMADAVRDCLSAVERLRPTSLILAGYSEPVMRALLRWAEARGVPTVLLMVSTWHDRPRNPLREWLKARLLRRFSLIAATGVRAEQYAVRLGVDLARIHVVGNVVGNGPYADAATRAAERDSILMVTRLAPEKDVLGAIAGFRAYRQRGGRLQLVLCGDGPQRREVEAAAAEGGIRLDGWVQGDALVERYARARILLLPSVSEPWGLVVNEGIAAGCIPIASAICGCVPELVHDGWNGVVLRRRTPAAIAEALLRVEALSADEAETFRSRGRAILAAYTPVSWAAAMATALTRLERGDR